MEADAVRNQRGSEDRGKNCQFAHIDSILDSFMEAESLLKAKYNHGEIFIKNQSWLQTPSTMFHLK